MQRELLILRHGKSDWSRGASDYERPLTERGFRETERLGRWLAGQGLVPDLVCSSPARRARQTAEAACRALGCAQAGIRWEESFYLAGRDELLALVRRLPEDCRRVLLVGHNPGLEELLEYLAGGELPLTPGGKLLPTASVAGLVLNGSWRKAAAANGRLAFLKRGKKVREGG